MLAYSVPGTPRPLAGVTKNDGCPRGKRHRVGFLQVPPVPSPIISGNSKESLLRLTVSKERAPSLRTRRLAMTRLTEADRTAGQHSTILPSTSMTPLLSPTTVRPAQQPKIPLVTAEFIWRLIMTGKARNTVGPGQPATPIHLTARPTNAL